MQAADDAAALARIFERAECVLLDFDGPVCSVYAGRPSAALAAGMRATLAAAGVVPEDEATAGDDPLVVLTGAARRSRRGQELGESLLSAGELRSITSARPTAGANGFLSTCAEAGMPVVIVSNNGEVAIRAYLDEHRLTPLVHTVVGRDRHDVGLLKPSPQPLRRGLASVGCDPARAVMIGDSVSDVQAARAAAVPVVALAGTSRKLLSLRAAGPDAVITGMPVATAAIR